LEVIAVVIAINFAALRIYGLQIFSLCHTFNYNCLKRYQITKNGDIDFPEAKLLKTLYADSVKTLILGQYFS